MKSLLLILLTVAAFFLPASVQAAPSCQFILGFATLDRQIPDIIGQCLQNQYFAADGNAYQQTTNGLLVWRKAHNETSFTNGYQTWLLSPYGLQERLNTQRFAWEVAGRPVPAGITVIPDRPPAPAPSIWSPPLHADTALSYLQALAAHPGPGRVIVIHLVAQSLTAYDSGQAILTTPVTTGRRYLRTPVGVDTITWHASPYLFISPWPRSSPFWYPRSWVHWVLHFHSGGYFIHDAPWEPNWAYGPGSENGPYSSHGCVQVPYTPMRFLYRWATNGTRVIIVP